MDKLVLQTISNLKDNGFDVQYFETSDEAKEKLLEEIGLDEDIGIGGSMTVYNMKLHEELIERGNNVYWHWLVDGENRKEVFKKASDTPVYISSSNGITQDGKIVNIDGVGNRVASMFYGHNRTYIIAGINKISKNVEDSIKRIKSTACPKNAERLNLETPCRYKGCTDCKSKDRMCNITVIMDHKPMATDVNVFLINEELGF